MVIRKLIDDKSNQLIRKNGWYVQTAWSRPIRGIDLSGSFETTCQSTRCITKRKSPMQFQHIFANTNSLSEPV